MDVNNGMTNILMSIWLVTLSFLEHIFGTLIVYGL